MSRFATCLATSLVLLSTSQMSFLASDLDAEVVSNEGRQTILHVTTLAAAPTALY